MSISITPATSFPSISSISSNTTTNKVGGANDGGESFGSTISKAVSSIEQSQKSAEEEVARAVSGESQDLHKTIIALQTADLHFQLGLQVRNKLVSAYDDIMRMQV
jgi:flagellar hook-basal body complex protein FliE